MKLFNITDLHGHLGHLEAVSAELAAADLVVISGDITNSGGRAEAQRIIERVAEVNPRILAVSGNWDRDGVEAYLSERDIDLHGRARRQGALRFVGLSGSLPGPAPTPTTYSEEELRKFLELIPLESGERFVLVSHQPPYGTKCDIVSRGRHVGSRAVREFIERTGPLLCLTGHIHEAVGQDVVGECRVVNPGPFGHGGFALIDIDPDGTLRVKLRTL